MAPTNSTPAASLPSPSRKALAPGDHAATAPAARAAPPAAVARDPVPAHQVGVEPGLAGPPAGAAVEGDPLVAGDLGLSPVGRDLRVRTHRVVDVAVVLHVVRVRAAVAPHVALDPAGRADVVVAADVADVLTPGADAHEGGAVSIRNDLLRLIDVDDALGPKRDLDPEARDRGRLPENGFKRVAGAYPPVVAAIEKPHVVDAGVTQDHQRPGGGDLPRPSARPLLVRMALGVASVDDDRRVVGDAKRSQRGFERLGRSPVPVGRILQPVGVEVMRPRDMALRVFLGDAKVHVEEDEATRR